MIKNALKSIDGYVKQRRQIKRWQKIVTCLAAFVVFCTTYALILPAITQEDTAYCGIEEHQHDKDTCYEKRLTCGQGDAPHVHSEGCYEKQKTLTCPLEETEGHSHTSECVSQEKTLHCETVHEHTDECYTVTDTYVCGMEETPAHVHTDECYEEKEALVCNIEENNAAHQHTDECYEMVLTCEKTEHTHELACYSNPEADLETEETWKGTFSKVELTGNYPEDVLAIAKSQLGYQESEKNYTVDGDGNKKGYTRYGAWYGDAYGDWCAMFASFCLHYAEVEDFPLEASSPRWVELLQKEEYNRYRSATEYTPKPGDVIFFDWDGDEGADHVGLVAELTETAAESTKVITIEGNSGNRVQYVTYEADDERILGYGELPLHGSRKTLVYEGEDYTVQVSFTKKAAIPENAELSVRELTGEEYEASREQAKEAMGAEELSFARFFDVSFLADDAEIEPAAPVEVKISYTQSVELPEGEQGSAVHFTEDGVEILDVQTNQGDGGTSFSFTQDSFSVVGTAVRAQAAPYAAAPNVGGVTGTQVDSPQIGQWYIIYNDVSDGYNTGFVLSASDPNHVINEQLTQISTNGGTVAYQGNQDVAWQYTADGFRNRNGQYLTLETCTTPGDLYHGKLGLSTSTANAKTTYLKSKFVIYNGGWDSSKGDNVWNFLAWNNWNSRGCHAILGDQGTPGNRSDRPTYIARIASSTGTTTPSGQAIHPDCAITGTPTSLMQAFYNIDGASGSPEPHAGFAYRVWNTNGTYDETWYSGTDFMCPIERKLSQGTYYIEQVGVPKGEEDTYIVVPQRKQFTVGADGMAAIGIFYDYKASDYGVDKTAQCINYENRIYQLDLTAKSGKYVYKGSGGNYQLIVDQSNSMLFPADLTPTGDCTNSKVTLNGNGYGNSSTLDTAGLKHDKLYYLIGYPTKNATVYALWYDNVSGKWLYQDASFYAKAKKAGGDGNNQNNNADVPFAVNGAYNSLAGTNGGGMDSELKGDLARNFWGNPEGSSTSHGNTYSTAEFTVYEGSQFNRLHYLQESMLTLINQLRSIDENTTVSVIKFTGTVDHSKCVQRTLSEAGVKDLMRAVNTVNTSGGTRPDLAFNDAINNHIDTSKKNYVILVTDGAPQGGNDGQGSQSYALARSTAANITSNSNNTLITIGLSMNRVESGKQLLSGISSGGYTGSNSASPGKWCFTPDDASRLSHTLVTDILSKMIRVEKKDSASTIRDTVSDSFYLVDQNGSPLKEGDWVTKDGNYTKGSDRAGQVHYNADTKEWYVEWVDQTLHPTGEWHGKLYVKAKEDFIGGNAIQTNKSATITLKDGTGNNPASQTPFSLPSPTVNVRLLPLNEISGESTVFLGDNINVDGWHGINGIPDGVANGIPDALEDLCKRISFSKLRSDYGDAVYNRQAVGSIDSDTGFDSFGNAAGSFTVGYAIDKNARTITADEWETLKNNGKVYIPYTYSDADSNGPVGYFTMSLEVGSDEGCTTPSTGHGSDHVGHDVVRYALSVEYTALKLGEALPDAVTTDNGVNRTRPGSCDHTTSGGNAGTEVDPNSSGGLNSGAGKIDGAITYEISVVDGRITVLKELEQPADADVTFSFRLGYLTLDDEKLGTNRSNYAYGTILIPAGQTTGTVTHVYYYNGGNNPIEDTTQYQDAVDGELVFRHLKRGSYLVTEDTNNEYVLKSTSVVEERTNCSHINDTATSTTFHIGYHPVGNENDTDNIRYQAIKSADGFHIVYTEVWQNADQFLSGTEVTDYHGESYGTVKFLNTRSMNDLTIPVEKKWASNVPAGEYGNLEIYVALCNPSGEPILDEEGNCLLLVLNGSNSWEGSFTTQYAAGTTPPGYTVKEVSGAGMSPGKPFHGKLVNTGKDTIIYFDSLAENHGGVEAQGKGFLVSYAQNGETGWTVTNEKAYALPKTGGSGTLLYTIGGILLMSIPLMYDIKNRRRKGAKPD